MFTAPLTPEMRALLDKIRQSAFPPIYQLPVEQARVSYRTGVGVMEQPQVEVDRLDDFTIPGPAGPIRARLWAPTHNPGLPVLLYLHGGGFVVGSIETCEGMCRQIAQQSGAAVIAIDYRLAPEHKFPAGLDDCFAALQWLVREGAALGLDTHRIAVGGDSGGGTLAASTALLARDAGIKLALQLLFYPSVQTSLSTSSLELYSKDLLLSTELMRWFNHNAHTKGEALDWRREPLKAPSHAGVAPAWIGLAQCDALTDDGYLYADKLREAGVPVEVQEWPGVIHDFINMSRFVPQAALAHTAAAQALVRAFA
jgi:acetyl esterase